jgi:hypothetical protein
MQAAWVQEVLREISTFLVDIASTNAWVYYKLCHEEKCKKEGARGDFFEEELAESMVNGKTNWLEYDTDRKRTANASPTKAKVSNLDNCYAGVPNIEADGKQCIPVQLNTLPVNLSTKIKICQICRFEERKPKWKSVMLYRTHGICLCMEIREEHENCKPSLKRKDGTAVKDFSWTCQTMDTCWNKFHQYYQPKGLFNSNFFLESKDKVKFVSYAYGLELYQKKYAAIGANQTRTPKLTKTEEGAKTKTQHSTG